MLIVEMMTMLLQLFFDHQCISIPEIIDWYLNENSIDEFIGKNFDKKWAQPFLNRHGYQIESTSTLSQILINSFLDLSEVRIYLCQATDPFSWSFVAFRTVDNKL
jgi:hypothetical protein